VHEAETGQSRQDQSRRGGFRDRDRLACVDDGGGALGDQLVKGVRHMDVVGEDKRVLLGAFRDC